MGVGLHIVIVGSALREWSIQDDVAVIGRVEAIGRKIVLIELRDFIDRWRHSTYKTIPYTLVDQVEYLHGIAFPETNLTLQSSIKDAYKTSGWEKSFVK